MTAGTLALSPFEGPVWRLLAASVAEQAPLAPAAAPEGRFHHSGQTAIYASLSILGTRIAIQRYLSDDVPRVLVPMWLSAAHVVDMRGARAASVVWQDIRAAGDPSPTWSLSDAARQAGAQAMLYSSRSRPELAHVVVFDPQCLRCVGPASVFTP
tara:strand:+ start:170 stop:634 length:465 start_codon:yes stop_codon:yes gene_type:complete